MRVQVKAFLSGILDKVEDKMQISIKRPPEYEKLKRGKQPSSQALVETSDEDAIDSTLHGNSKRNVVRLYVCKIVEDAASQLQVTHIKDRKIDVYGPSFVIKSKSSDIKCSRYAIY